MVDILDSLAGSLQTFLPAVPGGPMEWILGLAFAAAFAAVVGTAAMFGDDPVARRLAGGAAVSKPPSVRRGIWRAVARPRGHGVLRRRGGGAAAVLPGRWRSRRAGRYRRAIARGFPDALDMMVVCVEAGLGLDAALSRVGGQIAPAHPLLAAELALVALELLAGKSREAALRACAARTGVAEIASFATLLIQSDALGSGIAQTLRVQAEEMRAARMLRAEEMAHTLPVKLTIPLVACILPAMIAVVLLPGIITIVRDVLPGLGR